VRGGMALSLPKWVRGRKRFGVVVRVKTSVGRDVAA
jgi:hypothetical protein